MTRQAVLSDAPSINGAVAVRTAVLVIPAGTLIFPDAVEKLFYLLATAGAVMLLAGGQRPWQQSRYRLLALLSAGFFAAALLSLVVSGSGVAGFERLDRFAHFLVAPFFAVLVQRAGIGSRHLMLAVKLSAVVVCAVALAQFLGGNARPGGAVNPLLFGALSLLLGFFSLVRLPLETPRQKAFSILAFFAGGSACVLTQSRGVWLEAVLLPVVVLFFWRRCGMLSKPPLLHLLAALLALLTMSCSTLLVQQRIDTTVTEYQAFRDQEAWQNSVAIRLIMWHSGLRAAARHPLSGWGLHRTQQAATSVLNDPAVRNAILGYTHLHNEYINTLVGRGITGVLSLLLLLLLPALVFVRQAQRPQRLAVNGIGALLCAGYALSGMTNLAFGHEVMNIFFITFLSLTLTATNDSITGDSENACATGSSPA